MNTTSFFLDKVILDDSFVFDGKNHGFHKKPPGKFMEIKSAIIS